MNQIPLKRDNLNIKIKSLNESINDIKNEIEKLKAKKIKC